MHEADVSKLHNKTPSLVTKHENIPTANVSMNFSVLILKQQYQKQLAYGL